MEPTIWDDGVLRVAKAREMLDCSVTRMYRLMDSGVIPYRYSGRARVVPVRAVLDYLKNLATSAGRPTLPHLVDREPKWGVSTWINGVAEPVYVGPDEDVARRAHLENIRRGRRSRLVVDGCEVEDTRRGGGGAHA